jgi:hypothetical protein
MTDDHDLPVLDDGPLQALKDEAGDAVARAFMEEYLLMLPLRAAKVIKGLAAEDIEPGIEALISLKVSSAMAGALRLEGYCGSLERALRRGHVPDAGAVKSVLLANIRMVVRKASHRGHLPTRRPGSDGSAE